jgi:CysZ protein
MTFSFATSIVACPFNDVLAERTEKLSTPLMKVVTHQTFLFKLKILGIDLLKSIATLVTGVFILLLSWIPGVNILALPIGCALFCFQYISYPQTRRGIGMLGGVAFIARHFYSSLGFGASVAFLFSIPLLSLFALPLAVVGGTLLVARANGDDTLPALR